MSHRRVDVLVVVLGLTVLVFFVAVIASGLPRHLDTPWPRLL
ncbi:MAG: hypothetical protein Q8L55_00885 [Phycisphaerales bacterium]|nr:hypothetical protein [Phycisphaerales bacterium]